MKLTTIALKNLKKNFSFYALYLFSVSFILMIFFSFMSFSQNTVIMEKISSDGRVEMMCRTVAVFIMAFVIFYMSYANKFFMRRRMRELGIYSLLGYRKTAILQLLTAENTLICSGGLLAGIIVGSILHKGLTAAITGLLDLSIDLSQVPFFNANAIFISTIFVAAVMLALMFSNARLLGKSTLLDLVRLEKKNEKPVKIKGFTAIFGAVLTVVGYALALDIVRGAKSLWVQIGFSPIALLTVLCVVLGTVLFIYSFLPFFCSKIRRKKSRLYKENTIIVVPKFMHRIRSNAKSLILLILLTAGTLAIFGATVLSIWYPIAALGRIIPAALEFRIESEEQAAQVLEIIEQTVGEDAYQYHVTSVMKATAEADTLPEEYTLGGNNGRAPCFECISEADYLALMSIQGNSAEWIPLAEKECVLVKYRPDPSGKDLGNSYMLSLGDSQSAEVNVRGVTLQNPIGFGNSVGTLILSDSLYRQLQASGAEQTDIMSIDGDGIRANAAVYENLNELLSENSYFVSAYQRQSELVHENSSTFLLITFATVIFLIATGSILYFQNISSVTYDKDDYTILGKMGYSHEKLKRIVRRQTQIYFLIPYAIGLLHSVFAITCYKSALMDDLLGNSGATILPVALAIAIFTIIYAIYYQITKYACYRIALRKNI